MIQPTRRQALGALLIVGITGIGASAVQQPPAGRGRGLALPGPPVVEVQKLSRAPDHARRRHLLGQDLADRLRANAEMAFDELK